MALYFKTPDPNKLLKAFKAAIDEGHIVTWAYDDDDDFTHTTDQWENEAWLRPKIETGQLALYIFGPEGQTVSEEVYAIYHGRFIESMLAHCDMLFTDGIATAMPAIEDSVS